MDPVIDAFGHLGYIFIFGGQWIVTQKWKSGFLIRLIGTFTWGILGFLLGSYSIVIWSTIGGIVDAYGWLKWKEEDNANLVLGRESEISSKDH